MNRDKTMKTIGVSPLVRGPLLGVALCCGAASCGGLTPDVPWAVAPAEDAGPGDDAPPQAMAQQAPSVGAKGSALAGLDGVGLVVVGPAGEPIGEYRWLIEEDQTYHVEPGVPDPRSLAVSFHRSSMRVVARGDEASRPGRFALDPTKRYHVTVMPTAGYTSGGASFRGSDASVTVRCTKTPLPTAQVSVFVFEDSSPANGAPDLPQERGLAGFRVLLTDAGGRYGMAGGQFMQDVFGNPIGTTYAADGKTVLEMGRGYVLTDASGNALIKNLSQGKFTVSITPPRGEGWVQTTTIEGTRGSDAWVKPNEPRHFQEFGPPGWHTFFGFVKEGSDSSVLRGGASVSGQVVNNHISRPPTYTFSAGEKFEQTTPYVALNQTGGTGRAVFVKRCASDGSFTIPNVPAGTWQLMIWDSQLDNIMAFHTVVVRPGDGAVALGKVPVFSWFAQLRNFVFEDANGNGVQDEGEAGIPDVGLTIRWRDGSTYQNVPTDATGYSPFYEVFPFFAWQVIEVDSARLKSTGATFVVDDGGALDPDDPWSFGGLVTPQRQPGPGNLPYRTEVGPVNMQGFQSFIGTSNVALWGKKAYGPGENGGIQGVAYYDAMRGADDPRYAGNEPHEVGIPRLQVNLYKDGAAATRADVDNWPVGNFPGPEDVDRNANGVFDKGDAIAVTHTASWDDRPPTGCVGAPFVFHGAATDCFDGLRNFNQMRPAVYDGFYSFQGIPAGAYVVEIVPPRSPEGDSPYQLTKEEDRNFDFGDDYEIGKQMEPPSCVGDLHRVPDELALFPGSGIAPRFAGQDRPLCDRKKLVLRDGANGKVDFFLFTEVPIAGHIYGMILDDASNEFDVNAPTFGEKYAPPWLPISIRDWDGVEIGRTYSDEYGLYNALVPSNFDAHNPLPSGLAPKMLTTCMNDPGPIPDPANPGKLVVDPHFNPQYSQFCYTFQYTPGTTTYLDTPVLPVAAFAGPTSFPLDCERTDGSPRILSVSGPQGGPYVASVGQQLTIAALGQTAVPNPAFDGQNGTQPRTVMRDFGFGATTGKVTIGGLPCTISGWSAGAITAFVPAGARTGELVVTRGDNGKSTVDAVTVTVGTPADTYRVVRVAQGGSIQAAIDGAQPGDLILVPPGRYDEPVILWKPVKLQGWGPGSTHINAAKVPAEKLVAWRAKVSSLISTGQVSLVPNQGNGAATATEPLEPVTLFNEEGPGVLVLARNVPVARGGFGLGSDGRPNARIDGFTIGGGDNAGGIMVNGYARYLEIANNRILGNAGTYGGGVRFGHPFLTNAAGTAYQSSFNDRVRVHHNDISRNGGLEAAGGGVAIYTGTDAYSVEDNFICGNFSGGHGGGVGHLGESRGGVIARNQILFNETFFQQSSVHGGGIFVGGEAGLAGGLSPGSGSVAIDRNVIQGNGATSGDGGGIRVQSLSGADVAARRNTPEFWNRVDITNNVIVDNVAAFAGGGISLADAPRVFINHNTIVRNDSTGTAGEAFKPGSPNQSTPQPAGIVSRLHSPGLAAAFGPAPATAPYRAYSNPELVNDIIWQNRSFYFKVDPTLPPPGYRLLPDVAGGQAPSYWDLAVLGGGPGQALKPQFCDLTDSTGLGLGNFTADPQLVASYFNGAANQLVMNEITTGIAAPAAFDEGGNWIKVRFGPISQSNPTTGALLADGHLRPTSPARGKGMTLLFVGALARLTVDLDGQPRPLTLPDVGADQVVP